MGSKFLTRVGSQNQIDLESHCTRSYEEFYEENPPIPTRYLREMPSLILQDSMEKITSKLIEQPWGRK